MSQQIDRILGFFARVSMVSLLMMMGFSTGFYYLAFFDDGSSLKKQIAKATDDLKKEKDKEKITDDSLKERDVVVAAIAESNNAIAAITQQLPQELGVAEILRGIDAIAMSTGVKIVKKEPRTSKTDELVEAIPLSIKAEGKFSELTTFIYYISSLNRLTRVNSFAFTEYKKQSSRDKKEVESDILSFDSEIVSYRMLTEQERAEAEAKKNKNKRGRR